MGASYWWVTALPLEFEEEVIEDGGLWGEPSLWPVRGHRVNGLYPQQPLWVSSRCYEVVTGLGNHGESPSRVTEVSNEALGAPSRVWGEESVELRGCSRSPLIGLARALLTARLRPATAAASAPVTDRRASPAGTGRGP
jgi:hypothetical protein